MSDEMALNVRRIVSCGGGVSDIKWGVSDVK